MLDKLKFWKSDEPEFPGSDFSSSQGFVEPFTSPQGVPEEFSQDPAAPDKFQGQQYPPAKAFPGSEQFARQQRFAEPPEEGSRETELILAKLDAIKSELDSLHQRVRRIEQLTDKSQNRYW